MKGKAMAKTTKERAVLVTTEHRGVFFGYAEDIEGTTIDLKRARLCVYWSADVRGFMGLAGAGPTKGCKIGPEAPSIKLHKVTAVLACSEEAEKAWQVAPWG